MAKRLDQRGISTFEIAIIILTILLVIASSWIISKRIDRASKENYEKTQIMDQKND